MAFFQAKYRRRPVNKFQGVRHPRVIELLVEQPTGRRTAGRRRNLLVQPAFEVNPCGQVAVDGAGNLERRTVTDASCEMSYGTRTQRQDSKRQKAPQWMRTTPVEKRYITADSQLRQKFAEFEILHQISIVVTVTSHRLVAAHAA